MILAAMVSAALFALSEQAFATITVATVTAVGGIVIAFIQSLRKANSSDHLSNQSILLRMHDEQAAMRKEMLEHMDRIEGKVDDHISHHAHGGEKHRARKR